MKAPKPKPVIKTTISKTPMLNALARPAKDKPKKTYGRPTR
jgi:hypothetical protein